MKTYQVATVENHRCSARDMLLRGLARFQAHSQNYEKRLLASSYPSSAFEKLGFRWRDFHEKLYLKIFRKSV
jgi:hypothetical protein